MLTYTHQTVKLFPYYRYVTKNLPSFHQHSFWEFAIFLEGTSINSMPDKDETYYPYSTILMRPHLDAHTIKNATNKETMHLDIYVHDDKMRALCNMLSLEGESSLYDSLLQLKQHPSFLLKSNFISHLNEQLALLDHPNMSTPLKENIHSAIVLSLLSNYTSSLIPLRPLPFWLQNFIQTLKNPSNFCEDIEKLTNEIPYSRSQICRDFKKFLGKTMREFFTEQKMLHATTLLMSTNYKVIDIANLLGYSSPKNFIQQFTKQFGYPPSVWKKKLLLSPASPPPPLVPRPRSVIEN